MKVARIEIFGFKSFLDRLILPIQPGLTGVVGPNGCGKSNIVDALRWVLGETRASSLRGTSLEDVIFNGTEKLRPLGLAEVTLTLKASERDFFSDLLVSLGRTQEQVPELVLGAALDSGSALEVAAPDTQPAEHGTLVRSGRPNLRVISGALDPQHQPESSEPSLDESMPENELLESGATPELEAPPETAMLTRYAWLKSVEEVQITRRLYRSGESEFFINRVPCRLKDIKELFRVAGLGARAYTIVAQGEVSRIVTSRPEERRLIIEEAAGVTGFRDKIAAANRRLEETATNISRIEDVIKEVTRQVNSLRVQASRAKNRQELRDRLRHLERLIFGDQLYSATIDLTRHEQQLDNAKQAQELSETSFQRVYAEEHEVRAALMGIDLEGDSIRAKIDSLREELANRGNLRSDYASRLTQVRTYIQSSKHEHQTLSQREETLQSRLNAIEQEKEVLKEQEESCNQEISQLESLLGSGMEEQENAIRAKQSELNQADQESRELKERLVYSQSREDVLEEQLQSHTPASSDDFPEVVTELLKDLRPLFQELTVPPQYARAFQAALGEGAGFLVCSDALQIGEQVSVALAVSSIPQLKHKLGLLSGEGVVSEAKYPDNVPFRPLVSLIAGAGREIAVLHRLLAGTYFCDTIQEGRSYFAANPSSPVKLVTMQGEILTGFSYAGSAAVAGPVQIAQEVKELRQNIGELEERLNQFTASRAELQQTLGVLQEDYQKMLDTRSEKQALLSALHDRRGELRGKLNSLESNLSQIRADLSETKQRRDTILQSIAEYQAEEGSLASEVERLSSESDQESQSQLLALREEYSRLDGSRKGERERLSDLSNSLDQIRLERDQARQVVSDCTLEVQRVTLEIEHLKEKIVIEYGQELLTSLLSGITESMQIAEQVRLEYREEADRIRQRIQREGEVDTSSIERFEEEKARLENLTQQKLDLEEAQAILKKTIQRLTETSEQRFLATFNAVRENFAKLIPRLFGGGKASLELLDPTLPLETGVEIIIRPPGKKLKTIDLLSGGEKALCAIALIVSMFMQRPSPLCVLDEVDAPLDEANLVRFLSLIKEMSAVTQFVMVTHNKQTMQVADNLIGVTMQQPGASKVIAVSLQEAYSHVA